MAQPSRLSEDAAGKLKNDMTKRRAAVIGKRGAGSHHPETVLPRRPHGEVKPVISRQKNGRPVDREVADAGCMGVVLIILIASIILFS